MIVIRKENTLREFIINYADDIIDIIRESLEKTFKEYRGYNLKSNSSTIMLNIGTAV